eukprot:TRINITY_DN1418_c0_g2_i1.p1 TRINITY_DN1418_c0_g2~~TRINITY_DN1418_c0_g2_i1.p1  ORF type:complete len:165 (+),score=54.53 TRINITY_DN1418_c0_g2_i1:62-496(+)
MGGVVHVAVHVLREVTCVRVAGDAKEVVVGEFEVTDKHSRVRVMATTKALVERMRELVGKPCIMVNVTSRVVPTKQGEGHFRLLATHPTCIAPCPCNPEQEQQLTHDYHLQHGLLPHLLKTAASHLPATPEHIVDDRSFECYDV